MTIAVMGHWSLHVQLRLDLLVEPLDPGFQERQLRHQFAQRKSKMIGDASV